MSSIEKMDQALDVRVLETENAELRQALALLNADVQVAKFEVKQLTEQRDAVRAYLQGTKIGDALTADTAAVTAENLKENQYERIADRLIAGYVPLSKIQAIKEMRDETNLSLMEAKNQIDAAINRSGQVGIGTRGELIRVKQ